MYTRCSQCRMSSRAPVEREKFPGPSRRLNLIWRRHVEFARPGCGSTRSEELQPLLKGAQTVLCMVIQSYSIRRIAAKLFTASHWPFCRRLEALIDSRLVFLCFLVAWLTSIHIYVSGCFRFCWRDSSILWNDENTFIYQHSVCSLRWSMDSGLITNYFM